MTGGGRGAALGLGLAVSLLVFGQALSGEARFFYRDVTRQYEPLQAQLDRAWAQRELPTWNASTQGGVPLLANLHSGVFAPWWPLFRALPFDRAYALAVAAAWALWLAGLLVFLGRRSGTAAGVVGALSGAFAGVALGATSYLPLLAGLACIPWQCVALDEPRPAHRVGWLVSLFTVQLLTGDPSTALMGALACLCVAWTRPLRGTTASVVVGGLLALGLCAAQLLPALTLYGESARAASSLEARLGWSFHPARALEWLVRLPHGGLLEAPFFTRWDLSAGPDPQPFFLEHGWGLPALLLLGPALLARGAPRRLGLALVALGFGLSLGRHLGPLQHLFDAPPLSLFRFPERYGALAALGAAVLTAHGAQALLGVFQLRRRWAGGWLLLATMLAGLSATAPAPTDVALRLAAGLVAAAGVLGLVTARAPWAWLLAVLAVAAVDFTRAARASVLTLPAAAPPPLPASIDRAHRVWRENVPLRALEPPARGVEALQAERQRVYATLASATPGLRGLDELGGYSPVSLRRWQRVIQLAAQRPALLARLFDVCTFVSTEARGRANPEWVERARLAPGVALYASGACGGRAWTVQRAVPVVDTDEALRALQAPTFDAAREATREGPAAPLPPLGETTVTVAPRARASVLELSVTPSAQWALVVVSETWSPGWRVAVDGVEREVELLDGTLLGVAVPPGGRAVRFEYEEPLFTTGLSLSLATALGLLLLGLAQRRGRGPT